MNRIWDSEANRFTLYGAIFGFLFPIIATIIEALQIGGITIDNMITVQRTDPLLWIIDSAPLFLGIFARFAGWRQDQLKRIIRQKETETETMEQSFEDSNSFASILTLLAAGLIGVVLFLVVFWLQSLISTNLGNPQIANGSGTVTPDTVAVVQAVATQNNSDVATVITLNPEPVISTPIATNPPVPPATAALTADVAATEAPQATATLDVSTSPTDTQVVENSPPPTTEPVVTQDESNREIRLGLYVRPELDCTFATTVARLAWQELFDVQVQVEEFAAIDELIAAIANTDDPRHIDATLCYIDPTDRPYLRQYPGGLRVIGDGFARVSNTRLFALRSTFLPAIGRNTVDCIEAYLRNQEFDVAAIQMLEPEEWLTTNREAVTGWAECASS